MRIGVDFDNTIVCFDTLFHSEALKQNLIPSEVPATKLAVRDYLRSKGKDNVWTELQGSIYGDSIRQAEPYAGVKEFFIKARSLGHDVFVISHKTKVPALGKSFDLHQSARDWLEAKRFHTDLGLEREHTFFETSIPLKLERIRQERCDIFIDDLLEFLLNSGFPEGVDRILFSPSGEQVEVPFKQANSWTQIQAWIL